MGNVLPLSTNGDGDKKPDDRLRIYAFRREKSSNVILKKKIKDKRFYEAMISLAVNDCD